MRHPIMSMAATSVTLGSSPFLQLPYTHAAKPEALRMINTVPWFRQWNSI